MQPPHPPYLFNVLLSHIHSNIGNSPKFGEILVTGKITPNLKNSPKFGEILSHNNEFSSISSSSSDEYEYQSVFKYYPHARARPWIITAYCDNSFRAKNKIEKWSFLQIWGNSPILKFAMSPNLGKSSKFGCFLTEQ